MFSRALTLVEFLIVIVVVGIIMTIVVTLSQRQWKFVYPKALRCKSNLKTLYMACYDYAFDHGSFPWAGEGAQYWQHWALLVKWNDNGRKISPGKFVCPEFLNKRPAHRDEETGEWELGPDNVSYAYAKEVCSEKSRGYLAADMDVKIGEQGQGHRGFIIILACDGTLTVHKLGKGENWESVCGKWLTRR